MKAIQYLPHLYAIFLLAVQYRFGSYLSVKSNHIRICIINNQHLHAFRLKTYNAVILLFLIEFIIYMYIVCIKNLFTRLDIHSQLGF